MICMHTSILGSGELCIKEKHDVFAGEQRVTALSAHSLFSTLSSTCYTLIEHLLCAYHCKRDKVEYKISNWDLIWWESPFSSNIK